MNDNLKALLESVGGPIDTSAALAGGRGSVGELALAKGEFPVEDGIGEFGVDACLLMKSDESPEPATMRAYAKFNDHAYIAQALVKGCPRHLGGATNFRDLKHFKRLAKSHSLFKAAMDTAEVGGGAEWVPTGFSADFWAYADNAAVLFNLLPVEDMSNNPMYKSVEAGNIQTYLVGETTTYSPTGTNAVTSVIAPTARVLLTARAHGVNVPLSYELNEDSVPNIVDNVRQRLPRSFAHGRDDILQNGDTTGTQDSDSGGATHRRRSQDGLRKHGLANASTRLDISGALIADFRALIKKMGRYAGSPSNTAVVVGPKTYQGLIVGFFGVQELNQPGKSVVVVKDGRIQSIDGIPIYMSEDAREDLTTAGVYDGTTTTDSVVIAFRKDLWTVGRRKEFDLVVVDHPEDRQMLLVGTERFAIMPEFPTTNAAETLHTVVGYSYTV